MTPTVRFLTGPIRSGKTTRLAEWAGGRRDVGGVLSPDGRGGREFLDLVSGERVGMERPAPGERTLAVGRFLFRAAAFDWAGGRVRLALRDPRLAYVLIDEIGRLELAGAGFAPLLRATLDEPSEATLVLVVRDALLEPVREAFGLASARLFEPA